LQRLRVCAAVIAALDLSGERMHVGLQRLDGAARQRFVECASDIGEIGAQCGDGVLDATRLAQRLDLRRDVVELAFQAGEIGCRRLVSALPRLSGGRRSHRGFLERTLARRDFGYHLVDIQLLGGQRRRSPGIGPRIGCAAAGADRGVASRGQLFEPRVELGDGVREARAARRRRLRCALGR
jgi:hypothetical protein